MCQKNEGTRGVGENTLFYYKLKPVEEDGVSIFRYYQVETPGTAFPDKNNFISEYKKINMDNALRVYFG